MFPIITDGLRGWRPGVFFFFFFGLAFVKSFELCVEVFNHFVPPSFLFFFQRISIVALLSTCLFGVLAKENVTPLPPPHGYVPLYMRVSIFLFLYISSLFFLVVFFFFPGVCGNGEWDDGRPSREETERKSSTSASSSSFLFSSSFIIYYLIFFPCLFYNYHLRKREGDINQDGALQ